VRDSRNSAACCTFFLGQITVELAQEGIAVLLRPVPKMNDKVLDLLTCCFPRCLGAAEVDRIGLHQVGIALMLANDLAKVIAGFGAAVVSVSRLRR